MKNPGQFTLQGVYLAGQILQRAGAVHRQFSAQHSRRGAVQQPGQRQVQGLQRGQQTGRARQPVRIGGLRSKSWDEFAAADAPQFDFIFTVCDNAAGETCPIWPGKPATAHWGIPDPAAAEGDDEARRAAFKKAAEQLARRIQLFMSLPIESLDRLALKQKLAEIGQIQD